MKVLYQVFIDSVRQAVQQLLANQTRSFLSLLGVTIGIFCIISVLSAVDSLETDIRSSFKQLGEDVIYVSKMPWTEDPNRNYWKYLRRPNPDIYDYEDLKERLTLADAVSFSLFLGTKSIKYKSSAVNGAYMLGATYEYAEMYNIQFDQGRFFSPFEYSSGARRVVIGYEVASSLFGKVNPIGKTVSIAGHKMQVVGVIEKSGESIINPVNFDWAIVVGFNTAKKIANVTAKNLQGGNLNVKAKSGVDMADLRNEITMTLRKTRGQRPKEKNNFSLNELSVLSRLLDEFFSVLNIIGFIIGGFALVVGAFSVANIMFVSVRERTNIIGVKKALGAKSHVILLEFLIESVILCIVGGLFGILLVYAIAQILNTQVDGFTFILSNENIVYGFVISTIIGVASGIVPAYFAARMDPVEAIRK